MRGPRTVCSIQVNNPGGGGGAATVQTDGVTIQGDGSTGSKIALKQVETDATLTGAGTLASPLQVASWPVSGYDAYGLAANARALVTANKLQGMMFSLGYELSLSNITVYINAPDNANNNDIGLYNSAGTLVAHIGAQHIAGSAVQTFAVVGAPVTIPPGRYLFALTSAAGTFQLVGSGSIISQYYNDSFGTSSGGALPASITFPTASPQQAALAFILS